MDGYALSLRSIASHEREHKGHDELAAIIESAADMIERLRSAIRVTAVQGTYDEMAIRKAVSFELAELIVEARNRFNGQTEKPT